MKIIWLGISLLLSSVIMYGFIHLSISVFLSDPHGWVLAKGKWSLALYKTGSIMPLIVCVVLIMVGLYFIVKGNQEKQLD